MLKVPLKSAKIHFSKEFVPAVIGYVNATKSVASVLPKLILVGVLTVSPAPFASFHANTATIFNHL